MAETPKVFRFYKISEANTEISRLDGLLAEANAKLQSAGSNDSEIAEQATVLRSSNETLSAEVSRLTKELETAKAETGTARAEATRAKTDADAEKATIAAQVKTAAAAQAANIVSQVGVAATTATASTGAAPDFAALVKAQVSGGKTKAEAIRVIRATPEGRAAHAAWLASGNTSNL